MKKQSKSETPINKLMQKALKTAAAILKNEEDEKTRKEKQKMADYIEYKMSKGHSKDAATSMAKAHIGDNRNEKIV